MDTMKPFLLIIFIFYFLHLLVIGVSVAAAALQIQGMEANYTDGNSIPAGTYLLQYKNSISTLVLVDNTTISNITYSLGVDNMEHIIYIQDSQYATKNSTDITWVFPNSLEVNRQDRHLVEIKTDFYSPQYLPITLSRTMNQTEFSGEWYQKASFTVSFENITYAYEDRLCDSIWTGFGANENKNLNATILLDTFSTDAPGTFSNNIYSPSFNWNRSTITLNRVYNFSVVIRVVPNGTTPVIFSPYFGVVLFNGTYRDSGTSGTSTTMPDDMLPPHLTYATASQNASLPWSHYLLYGKGAHFNEIKNKVSSAPVASFSGTPTTGTAPLTVTFTDTSTNSPKSWNWTFGDGNSTNATLQNPVHTYFTGGNYTVSLNVSNAVGYNSTRKTGYITVSNPAVHLDRFGVFRPSTDLFYLDYNGNGAWNGALVDRQYNFGITGDIPVTGDWNSDARTEIGVFRPSTHLFYLDYNGNGVWNGAAVDRTYNFGITGDIPITGDWNNDRKSEIGVFRNSTHLFYLDYNGNGVWNGASIDRQYNFGITGDIPVTGDWNLDGRTEIGVFRPSTHLFYLDYNGNGAWNGVAVDRSYNFGITGDIPVSGDWNSDGRTEIGVFRPSTHLFYLDYNGNGGWNGAATDRQYNFGISGDMPISGDWN